MRDVSEREGNSLFPVQSLTSACPPHDLRSGPIYRFLSGSQLVQMTKIPFEIIHFCEITNFGHNSKMPFLVLQAGGLLEGLVQLSAVAHLSYILFSWPLYSAYHFAHHGVLRTVLRTLYFRFRHVLRTASASIQSVPSDLLLRSYAILRAFPCLVFLRRSTKLRSTSS